jgi:hypothetical protein
MLLQDGFRSPHRMLNSLVFGLSGFMPPDGEHFLLNEPELPEPPQKLGGVSFPLPDACPLIDQ